MNLLKKADLIKENEMLKKELQKIKRSLEQYKKENEQLSKYKKLGRKQYDEESTIKLMYDLYINENKSFKQVADTLNEQDIKTKLNKDWVKSSISCIMKNEKNIKKYLDKKQHKKFTELLESNKRNIKKK